MSTRKVAVMMPFGGTPSDGMTDEEKREVRTRQRRCMLEFLRLKYLITERVDVRVGDDSNDKIKYEVDLFQANVGDIERGALRLIRDADVLIGLITEMNVNVIYELAVRNVLRDIPILIVKGEPSELLPIYLQRYARIGYSTGSDDVVEDRIQRLAEDTFPPTLSPDDDIPPALQLDIDQADADLCGKLQDALISSEGQSKPERPDFIEEILWEESDPSRPLQNWSRDYYPFSVVKVIWKKKSGTLQYKHEDLGGIEVCHGNRAFLDLFDLDEDTAKSTNLDMETLLNRLETRGYISLEEYTEFIKDQTELIETIVFNGGFANAQVPLRTTARHRRIGEKSYLPCLIAKKVVGDTQRPHNMYLVVSYIDVTAFSSSPALDDTTQDSRSENG